MRTDLATLLVATTESWLVSLTPATVLWTAAGLLVLFFSLLAGLWIGVRHAWRLLGWVSGFWYPLRRQLLARWPAERAVWWRQRLTSVNPAELALLLGAAGAIWLAIAAVVEIAEAVLEPTGVLAIDWQVYQRLQTLRDPALDTLLVVITELGGAWITTPIVIAVASWLAWRRLWMAFGYWVGAAIAARLSVLLLKAQLLRPRPGNIYSGVESFSFPSGHATTAMVLYGFLAFLLAMRLPLLGRMALYAVAAVLVVLIGFSRLYLGVHWLTDVVAGFALGGAWMVLLALAFTRLHARQSPAPVPLAIVLCLALVGAGALRFGLQLDSVIENYQNAILNVERDHAAE